MNKLTISNVKVWMSEQDNTTLLDINAFLVKCVKVNQKKTALVSKARMRVGNKVMFHHTKTDKDVFGVIVDMGRSNATVQSEYKAYRVPFVMLQMVGA
jgi:hypothetical protein